MVVVCAFYGRPGDLATVTVGRTHCEGWQRFPGVQVFSPRSTTAAMCAGKLTDRHVKSDRHPRNLVAAVTAPGFKNIVISTKKRTSGTWFQHTRGCKFSFTQKQNPSFFERNHDVAFVYVDTLLPSFLSL